jgi:hypothetical protein
MSEATSAMVPSGSSGGEPDAAPAGAEKAPEVTLNLKSAAKRTATAMGSSGSSPPHKQFHATWTCQGPGMLHIFEDFLFSPLFCVGLLTVASVFQGIKPECDTSSLGV